MERLFITFKDLAEFNEGKGILSDLGYKLERYGSTYSASVFVYPEQEFQILNTLDHYQIWVDTFNDENDFLNSL